MARMVARLLMLGLLGSHAAALPTGLLALQPGTSILLLNGGGGIQLNG